MNLSEFNWLDWLIVLFLALSAVDGTRRGLLLGILDLLSAAVALAIALVAERGLGDWLAGVIPALSPALAHLGAFVLLLIVAQIAFAVTVGQMVTAAARAIAESPVGGLDRLLGLLPGLARGTITLALVLLPFALVPFVPSISQAIEQSSLANRLVVVVLQVMPTVEARLGQDLEGGLPSLVVAPPESDVVTERPLPIGSVGELAPDPTAEGRMLELVNSERSRAGLHALAADERLREVARAHSLEMFQLNYFSHTSPVAGSPFDRMRAARISFVLAGENLAYAPSVDIAHQGLMNSPGHRANILRPEFGRIGVGIIRSQLQGSMFTQEFTN